MLTTVATPAHLSQPAGCVRHRITTHLSICHRGSGTGQDQVAPARRTRCQDEEREVERSGLTQTALLRAVESQSSNCCLRTDVDSTVLWIQRPHVLQFDAIQRNRLLKFDRCGNSGSGDQLSLHARLLVEDRSNWTS